MHYVFKSALQEDNGRDQSDNQMSLCEKKHHSNGIHGTYVVRCEIKRSADSDLLPGGDQDARYVTSQRFSTSEAACAVLALPASKSAFEKAQN